MGDREVYDDIVDGLVSLIFYCLVVFILAVIAYVLIQITL